VIQPIRMWKREKSLRIFAISGMLVTLIFSGTLQHAQVPRVYFRRVENREALRWASQWEADQHGLALRAHGYGIYPLNKDTVLLFGELRTPAASIRSLLLRSDDGGKSWREVMSPVYGSEVIEVFFHDAHVGWALVAWTTEGPGDLALYRSKDGGKSWRKISDIPKRHFSGWPISMRFSDGKNGMIKLLYDGSGDPRTDGLVTLNTKNGGRSWHETSHLALDEYERGNEERKEAEGRMVVGQDSSQWQLLGADGEVRILRRLHSDETWRLLCVMPSHFGYSKGKVLVHAASN
jgi:hypothetical protein